MRFILKCIRYSSIVISFCVFLISFLNMNFNSMLIGIILMLISNILYSFEDIKRRVIFLFFQGVVFIFLISRPFISMLRGNKWWKFKRSSVQFSLVSLFLTLVFLLVGSIVMETILKNKKNKDVKIQNISNRKCDNEFIYYLQIVALLMFYISIACLLISGAEKLLFMRGREYEEYYVEFESKLPYLFNTFSSMTPYFLCIFLSTMPKKRLAVFPLFLYVFSAVPYLIIGMRNPIVLNIIFVVVYYFIRDIIKSKDESKWLGHFEKIAIVLFVPVAIIFLGALNYIRAGSKFSSMSYMDLIIDFLYKQGVSFDVLCIGYSTIPKIVYTGFKNYTFGSFIDYFTHGKIAQVLFGALSLGRGNNINAALYSNSFAHRMSFASRGQEYLQGHGWGSSYILETYVDFGYIGIIIFSIIIGMLLSLIIPAIKKNNWLLTTIMLMILTNIFFLPRDSATTFLYFIVTMQFILPVIFCYVVAQLFIKKYSYASCIKNNKYNITY